MCVVFCAEVHVVDDSGLDTVSVRVGPSFFVRTIADDSACRGWGEISYRYCKISNIAIFLNLK